MDSRTVGILGGGQLGRMLVEAANNRNISVAILDKSGSPAKQVNGTNPGVEGSFTDPQAIRELAKQSNILTVEIEHVNTQVLEELQRESDAQGKKLEIHPSWQAIRTIQDKYLQKKTLIDGKVAVAESIPITTASAEQLQIAAERLGLPFMLKARTGAYDGKGNHPIRSSDDYEPALKALKDRPLYAERWANFKQELAVMVVKTADLADVDSWETSTLSYPMVETVHEDSICKLVYAPARGISDEVNRQAQHLARRAVAGFKGRGIFGVESFLMGDGQILVNEIAPRPHNSGHYTIEACRISQYDSHLLAILDRPIPPKGLQLLRPSIMLNILGGNDPDSYLKLAEAADSIVGARVHLYGKFKATKGRKMGHITVLGDTMAEAEADVQPLIDIADKIRASEYLPTDSEIRQSINHKSEIRPLVSVTTGSISDQPKLADCFKVLNDLAIPYERRITSAHRTPHLMASYAEDASSRGIKVILAAAGGAAHLPGMVAAFAPTIPVVGLPIKPSIGDGMDSLTSMTNMPNGVPVLTVGVDKARNAALSAARILACWDPELKMRLSNYVKNAEEESLANDRNLIEEDIRRLGIER